MHRLTFFAVVALASVAWTPIVFAQTRPATLILISFDGFRWDYFDRADTPHFDRFSAEGVKADSLKPVFPTKTFPNHYTMVTGLYPDRHGIVANTMVDPELEATFSLRNEEAVEDGRWWGGEPVWVAVEKAGWKSAVYFWPGSQAPVRGVRPAHWRRYRVGVPPEDRIDQVLAWLDAPAGDRPVFVAMYFEQLDQAGHDFGPESEELANAVEAMDALLGRLLEGLDERGIEDQTNVVIVSDHGMAATSNERVVVLADYIDPRDVRMLEKRTFLTMMPRPGREVSVYESLRDAHPHLKVYRKSDLPQRFQYGRHARVAPLIGVADVGWQVMLRRSKDGAGPRGDHGYDPAAREMHGVFLARGPAFKRGYTMPSFETIHLYELTMHLLGLPPATNDGDWNVVRPMLKDPDGTPD